MTTPNLKANAPLDLVIRTFQDLIDSIGTVIGGTAGRQPVQVLDSYMQWTERAEYLLANAMEADVALDFLHTQRYFSLRETGSDATRLTPAVLAEAENRKKVLEGWLRETRAIQRRWQGAATLLVPDPSMLLEPNVSPEQIDWRALAVPESPGARVVIPLIVIHELDRLKRQGNSTTAKAAQAAIRWLSAILPKGEPHTGATLDASPDNHLSIQVFVQEGSSRPLDADLSIIQFAGQLAGWTEAPTILVTRDFGMYLRGWAQGVRTVHVG